MPTRTALLCLIALAGCASIRAAADESRDRLLRDISVGQIGCPAEAIAISDADQDNLGTSWVASCRGHRFVCSEVSGRDSSCHEELASAPAVR
jgi:hypothetical protein